MDQLLPAAVAQLLHTVSPARLCQACFTLASCAVLAVAITPSRERKLLVNYGARGAGQQPDTAAAGQRQGDDGDDILLRSVRRLTSLGQIPHMWFFTFYATYILCAAFWAGQYLLGGSVMASMARRQAELAPSSSPGSEPNSHAAVVVAWCLMLLQAARRLYESWALARPSRSTMWIVHWLLGQLFYVGISVAIWIEGSGAVPLQDQLRPSWTTTTTLGTLSHDALLKLAVAVPLFSFAWVSQYRCHKHLAGLRKYSLPEQGMFRHLISPHYTCECLIYLSLAIAAAPEGHVCNPTMLSALAFVAVNLGVTARGTKSWYAEKFGSDRVAHKRIMIPFVY